MRPRLLVALSIAIVVSSCATSADEETAASTTTTSAGVTETTEGPTPAVPDEGFIVQDGDVVEVHYVGTLDDGSQFDSSRERDIPFSFTVGTGQVISGFDEGVRGGKVGDVRTVRIEPANAYGEWSEANVVEVPFNPEQGDVEVGETVYLTSGQSAVVLNVTEATVTLDTNHLLAGEALTFEIEILAITRG